jgi:hypothetical protein
MIDAVEAIEAAGVLPKNQPKKNVKKKKHATSSRPGARSGRELDLSMNKMLNL